MGMISSNIDDIIDRYRENGDIVTMIMKLIWYVDSLRYGNQTDIATTHIRKRLDELFQNDNESSSRSFRRM